MWERYEHIIPHIDVGSDVIGNVTEWVLSSGYETILVVCDPNTYEVAGSRVILSLTAADLAVFECRYTEDEPIPDERAVGFLTVAFTPDIDLILGVGSGTINDICTFVGKRVGCPCAIVGTAPSMDGYASLGSAMLLDGVKVTPPTQCPVAIFCDIDILSEAPLLMSAAGLGDMLGKFTALADWKLANILVGEPMPGDIRSIVEDALDKIVAGVPHLAKREPDVIQSVTEGLILSGIAMSLYGDSRPASGTEHHLAHFWEMRMLAEGIKPALHGIKVGLATVIGLAMWKELAVMFQKGEPREAIQTLSERPQIGNTEVKGNWIASYARNDEKTRVMLQSGMNCNRSYRESYENDIRRLYGCGADAILKTENPNLPTPHIDANLQAILDIAHALPSPEDILAMLAAVDAPTHPSEILLSDVMLRDSIVYARDRKRTYTLLQLLGDLGLLDDFAERVSKYFSNRALEGVKCFVLDMDGTIYLGDNVFPYTKRFLEYLIQSGKDYVFYTNNSSQNAAHYLNKLQRMGITVSSDKLLMSTHVLLAYLRRDECQGDGLLGTRVFVAGTKALRDDFIEAGYTLTDNDPDFIVLGFDTDMDYERLKRLCDFVRSGLPYYGVHMDYNCPVEGGFIPDCGSLAAAVTASTGVTPEFFGKPSQRTLKYIVQKTGYNADEICFVGDRLYTDIAIASGTQARSVLVLSGETKRDDLQGSRFIPDLIVSDLTELMKYV